MVFSTTDLKSKFDTTTSERSLASNVESLISRMDKMHVNEIAQEFTTILNNPWVHVSERTKHKWEDVISKNRANKLGLMRAISNLYLAGARLAVEGESNDGDPLFEAKRSK